MSAHSFDLSIILPTYNEAANLPILVERLREALATLRYEIIIVDDNSPDGTYRVAQELAAEKNNITVLRRVTERGLSSAVLAGMAVAGGRVFVTMDADLQHDETIIPKMYAAVAEEGYDMAVGSREAEGGSYGSWSKRRRFVSEVARGLARLFLPINVTDPMSGFFAVSRLAYETVGPSINPRGFKILLEFIGRGSQLRVKEVGFTFRNRMHGQTKMSAGVVQHYLIALYDIRFGRFMSHTFLLYGLVGGTGVLVNLVGFKVGEWLHFPHVMTGLSHYIDPLFTAAPFGYQLAILSNFFLNNYLTFFDNRYRGVALIRGLVLFEVVSLFGLVVHLSVFQALHINGFLEPVFGESSRALANNALATVIALVSNYYLNLNFTWGRRS